MRKIDGIIVHCSATRPEWFAGKSINEKIKEIDAWHRKRGFSQIGYHYIIDRDGTVAQGRPVETVGAHAKGHNATTIGICIVGGFGSDADDMASEHFTPTQLAATYDLIRKLQAQYNIKNEAVIGHNRVSSKACPGFRVQKWLSGMSLSEATATKPERTKPTQSKPVKVSAIDIATKAGAGVTAITALDGPAQYIVLGFIGISVLFTLFIMRERLKAWAEGWH